MNVLLLPAAAAAEPASLATSMSLIPDGVKAAVPMAVDQQFSGSSVGGSGGVNGDSCSVSPCWLATRLRVDKCSSVQTVPYVLDFRRPHDFRRAHIHGSVNVVLPSLICRRLQRGSVTASSLIIAVDEIRRHRRTPLILIDDVGPSSSTAPSSGNNLLVAHLVYRRLSEEGYPVAFLQGGLNAFLSQYPEFLACIATTLPDASSSGVGECCSESGPILTPISELSPSLPCRSPSSCCVTKMKALRLIDDAAVVDAASTVDLGRPSSEPILSGRRRRLARIPCQPLPGGSLSNCAALAATSSPSSSFDYKSDGGHFPVEIIPNLYLGNASNAADMSILVKYKIKYIVNVTRNLPNAFQDDVGLKYLQIPIDDSWSQNLAAHFPQAIDFIDEARAKNCGVLVHCLAGISRSVTVTVAYLMHTLSLSLDEAYDLVKRHKPNISPNFDFLGQLVEFERCLVMAGRRRNAVAAAGGAPSLADNAAASAADGGSDDNGGGGGAADDRPISYQNNAVTVGTSS